MVLHTFGRDLKWNPHIHCLISEGGYSDDAFWRNVSHFNYTFLSNAFSSFNRWRTAILSSFGYDPHIKEEPYHEKEDQRATRKYISNPPEGMTSEDIRHMSEDDLLDMDCFLNEDVFGDDFGEEGFYIF